MKIRVTSNIKQVAKKLDVIQRSQIPFAASVAINETIGKTNSKGLRSVITREMNKRLDRPKSTTTKAGRGNNALFFQRSSKRNLTATLGFKDWASKFIKFLVFGGIRTTGKNIPIPYKKNARLDRHGNIRGKRGGLIRNQKQFFGNVGGVDGVYERTKREPKPRLIIGFKRAVNYNPIFPFYEIAGRYIGFTFPKRFSQALRKALRSAR